MIQELDGRRRVRQCNWVRFLVSTDTSGDHEGSEPNMTAMLLDGQSVFEVIKPVLPHTLIVVHFKDTARDGLLAYNGAPLGHKYASPTQLQGKYDNHFHVLGDWGHIANAASVCHCIIAESHSWPICTMWLQTSTTVRFVAASIRVLQNPEVTGITRADRV
jgi:hypothetical protein